MDQLRFDAGLGIYIVNVAPESIGTFKGMGTHYLRLQLEVGISEVGPEAGQLLSLETTLYAPQGSGSRVPLTMANASVAFKPTGEIRRETLQYLAPPSSKRRHHPHRNPHPDRCLGRGRRRSVAVDPSSTAPASVTTKARIFLPPSGDLHPKTDDHTS